MQDLLKKEFNFEIDKCKYNIEISFYCFDAISGNDLEIDSISIDGLLIYDIDDNTIPYDVIVQEKTNEFGKKIPFYYTLKFKTPIIFNIKIEKHNYYPFKSILNLNDYVLDTNFSIFDEIFIKIDIGRLPLLTTTKNNGITLTWNQYPHDIDAYLTNPTGEQTYHNNRETYFSIVDIDSKMGYGPETISINYWTDINANYYDDNKINTTFKYDVEWVKDGTEHLENSEPIKSIDASVHFFIDPTNSRTIVFPKELDNQNRKDQHWRVFEMDILSIYDRFQIKEDDYIISKYVNDNLQIGSTYYIINEEYISFDNYYYNILKNYDFKFLIIDESNNDVTKFFNINKIIEKYNSSYYSFIYLTNNHEESYCIINGCSDENVNGNYLFDNQYYNNKNVFSNGNYYLYYYNNYWVIGNELNNKFKYQNIKMNQISGSFKNIEITSEIFEISFSNKFIDYSNKNSFDDSNQLFNNTSNLKIKVFLNEEHAKNNLLYEIINFSSLTTDSFYKEYVDENNELKYEYVNVRNSFRGSRLLSEKMIPFVMYDINDNIINDVKYRWDYNNKRIYIEVLNRKYKLKEVKTIEYILGFNSIIDRSMLIDSKENIYKNDLNNLTYYFYLDKINLSKNVISMKLSNDQIKFSGFFTFKEKNTNIVLSRPKLFEIHPVPEKDNIKHNTLNESMLHENFIKINVSNLSVVDGQFLIIYDNLKILEVTGGEIPRELYDELMKGQLLNKKVNLIQILILENKGIKCETELKFTKFEWRNDGLLVSTHENLENATLDLTFKYNYFILNKFSFLGYEEIKENEEIYPNVYISADDDKLIQNIDFIYTWHPKDLRIFLKNDFDDSKTYNIEIVNNLKMHKFNFYYLNYFDKKLKVKFNIRNYDDYILNVDGTETLIENSRQKLGNLNFNLNERDVRRQDDTYILKVAKAEPSSQYDYENAIKNYEYDLHSNNIKCDWDYIASFDTIYKHNNYFEYISLYSDSFLKPTHVNKFQDETIEYELKYPLTNFYGWFIDNPTLNTTFYSFMKIDLLKERISKVSNSNVSKRLIDLYSYFQQNERNKLRCRLINNDTNLKNDLIYQYSLNYYYSYNNHGSLYKKFDGGYQIGRPLDNDDVMKGYKEEYTNFYSFMYKQKFSGDNSYPDNDSHNNRGTRHAVIPGKYDMELYYNNNSSTPISIIKNIDLTKENEKQRKTYNTHLQFPLVNFTGYIINKHSGNKESRMGVELKLTSISDLNSQIPGLTGSLNKIPGQYIYKFGNFNKCQEEYEIDKDDVYDSLYGRLNDEFQFLFQGFDLSYTYTWEENKYIDELSSNFYYNYGNTYYYHDLINMCAESALPSGIYKLELRYKKDGITKDQLNDESIPDSEKYDIFYSVDKFEISKDAEAKGLLYNYEIESPFIDFNGMLYEEVNGPSSVDILYGNDDQSEYTFSSIIFGKDWHIVMENINEPEKSVKFSYDSYGYKNCFQFRGFGRLKPEYHYSENYLSGYFSKGLLSGIYNLIINYKEKEIKRIDNIIINKENENLGKYDNVKINVGKILTNISGHFVDSKFNDFVLDTQLIEIGEEDYKEDINDSEFKLPIEEYGYLKYNDSNWVWTEYKPFNYKGETSNRYQFDNLKKFGRYAIIIYDNYHEHDGLLQWRNTPFKIKGVVPGKPLNELEISKDFNRETYKFDDFEDVKDTNILIKSNSGEGSHLTYDLLNLKDVTSKSNNLVYDIYLQYTFTKFQYHIKLLKNNQRYDLKVPINVTLSEHYDENDEEHIKLDDGTISGLINLKWSHELEWARDYSSYLLVGYTNANGFNNTIKTGIYTLNINVLNTNLNILSNDDVEISSSKYYVKRQIDINSSFFKDLKTVILTKYYSLDENDPKYQVVKLNSNNMFKTELEYSFDNITWNKYYDFDSYSKNTEETDLINYICTSNVLGISGATNDSTNQEPENIDIKFGTTLSIFDQLHKDLYIKFTNTTLYGIESEIEGIYDDINLNNEVRDNSIINEIFPIFENEDGTINKISGNILSLFEFYSEDYHYLNELKKHLISSDFKQEINLLNPDKSFAVSKLDDFKSDIKILKLKYIKVTIKGSLKRNDGSSIFDTLLNMNDMMKILIQLFKYDPNTKSESLIQEHYYLNDEFTFSNIETGFYKFKFFINNIELFEKDKGKIHTFNFNENDYNIILENYFPSLSGNVFFKGLGVENISDNDELMLISCQGMMNSYPDVCGIYKLINSPENDDDKIYKHITKNYYILATIDEIFSSGISWIITKFSSRCSVNDLNKDLSNIDTFFTSYKNVNNNPIDSFKNGLYYYYINKFENELNGSWSLLSIFNDDKFSYISSKDNNLLIPAIDFVHLDLIKNDLNDYNYFGCSYGMSGHKSKYFYQNTYMSNNNKDYSKYYLKDVLEGDYKIKYFVFPDGPPQYNHWSTNNVTDARTNFVNLYNQYESDEFKISLSSNIMNILLGKSESNEFKILANDFYNMIMNESKQSGNSQLVSQLYKSKNLRIFRIQLNYHFKNEINNGTMNCFSLIKFEDEFPEGGLYNNLSDEKYITIKINSRLENLMPKNNTSNIKWSSYEIDQLIISWADLLYETDVTISKDTIKVDDIILNYMYTYRLDLNCLGYESSLHDNSRVHTKIYENNDLITSGRFDDTNTHQYIYGLKTNTLYNCSYNRSSFELGKTNVQNMYDRYNYAEINCIDLYNISGKILNKSIEKCKNISNITSICNTNDLIMKSNYEIDYRLIYRGDENSTIEDDETYYSGYFNKDAKHYSFNSLLSGIYDIRFRARGWNENHAYFYGNYSSWNANDNQEEFSLISFNFKNNEYNNYKNIELPYINFYIKFEIINNKYGSKVNYIPASGIILKRNQKSIDSSDIYDEIFANNQSYSDSQTTFIVRSGYYDEISINCKVSEFTVSETYMPTVINENRIFRIYGNFEVVNVTIKVLKNGNLQPNSPVYIFDENKNLKNIVETNLSGEIVVTLKNIPYYFKAISQNNNFTYIEKIDNTIKTIELSY